MKSTSEKKSQAIGVFDSGFGGLTVMQQITKALPKEPIVFFADTARLPYGNKSSETIVRCSIENTIFLMGQNIKMLVVACSTASSCSLDRLRQIFNIPVIGTIEPGAEKAAQTTRNGNIAVIGTKRTISSGVFEKEILKYLPKAKVASIACPMFVPLVEEGFESHPAARMLVQEYLSPLKGKNFDTIILGCTHYPLLRKLIEEEVGKDVAIVDSALACAEKVKTFLVEHQLYSDTQVLPQYRYFVSDDPEKFRTLGRQFLGSPLDHVEGVNHF